jgi:hypothetical protein
LSSACLFSLSLACLVGLGALGVQLFHFLDDIPFLLVESDAKTALTLFDLLLLTSIGLWLLSCCVGALVRRVLLYVKGL